MLEEPKTATERLIEEMKAVKLDNNSLEKSEILTMFNITALRELAESIKFSRRRNYCQTQEHSQQPHRCFYH